MYNRIYYIIFPGLQYKANGPVWIDKIEVSASINNTPTNIYDISADKSQSVAAIKKKTSAESVTITDFATFLDNDTLYIQNKYSTSLSTFRNESSAGCGLAAVEFIGGTTDIIVFTVKLYTNHNWIQQDNDTILDRQNPEYKLLDTIEIKYNPFIILSNPPSLKTCELKRPWPGFSFSPTTPTISQPNISITEPKWIQLDSNIDLLSKSYDNLPMVPIVSTDSAWKASQGEVLGDGMLDDIQTALNCDKFHLLLFGAHLPSQFGGQDRDYDKLAICAYRTSVSGSVGRQRYTLVGVYKESLDVDVKWQQQISYDLSSYIQQVKYYSSNQFSITIGADDFSKDTVTFEVPNDLYKQSGDDLFSLQSGCSWEPVLSAESLGFSPLWDVWNAYASLRPYVWTTTTAGNRGTEIPTSVIPPSSKPQLSGRKSATIESTATKFSGQLDFHVLLNQLKDVRYLTFYDLSYQTQKFSSILNGSASTQLTHPVEGDRINVNHALTKVVPDIKIDITFNIDSVPTMPNYSIYPYVEFSYTGTDGGDQSYTMVESSDGSKPITQIHKITSDKVTCFDSNKKQKESIFYKAKSHNDCCWQCNEDDVCYILGQGESISIQLSNITGVVKYLILPKDPSKLEAQKMTIQDSLMEINDGQVTITNDYNYDVVVGSLGYLTDVTTAGTKSTNTNEYVSVIHTVGSYEDVTIFDKKIQWFYMPPADTFCIGFYKITSKQTVSTDDVVMLYDTFVKNEVILNQLVGFQYKISSL